MRKKVPVLTDGTQREQLKLIDGRLIPSKYIDGMMNYCCNKCGGRLDEGHAKGHPILFCTSCFKIYHFGFWGNRWDMAVRFFYEVTTA